MNKLTNKCLTFISGSRIAPLCRMTGPSPYSSHCEGRLKLTGHSIIFTVHATETLVNPGEVQRERKREREEGEREREREREEGETYETDRAIKAVD